jgi:hypothetical protein
LAVTANVETRHSHNERRRAGGADFDLLPDRLAIVTGIDKTDHAIDVQVRLPHSGVKVPGRRIGDLATSRQEHGMEQRSLNLAHA